jgi:predicted kinase
MIIQMAGLPGTGKSTIAARLTRELGATLLSKDHIRHTLFTPGQVAYDQDQDDFCASVLHGTAAQILRLAPGATLVFDGRTCLRAYQLRQVRSFATATGQELRIIECTCAEQTAIGRLRADQQAGRHPAANRDPALYHTLRHQADTIPPPKLVLSTDNNLRTCLTRCLRYLHQENRHHQAASTTAREVTP